MLILLSIIIVISIVVARFVVFAALEQINNICCGLFQSILTLLLHSFIVSDDRAISSPFAFL